MMNKLIRPSLLVILLVTSGLSCAGSVVGWVEKARIYPGDFLMHAKMDTGAKNSSLNASQMETFRREGREWVRVSLVNRDGKSTTLERPVERIAQIKRHRGNSQERPVITLGICVNDVYKEVEVSLIDRSRFDYQLLVGRSFMEGDQIIDPSLSYSAEPACPVGHKQLQETRQNLVSGDMQHLGRR